MSTKIRAWAATAKGGRLEPFEYDPGKGVVTISRKSSLWRPM